MGNKRFRDVIALHRPDYVRAPKIQKPSIAQVIVRAIRNGDPPGRFIRKDNKTGKWVDIGDKEAATKTTQALREKTKEPASFLADATASMATGMSTLPPAKKPEAAKTGESKADDAGEGAGDKADEEAGDKEGEEKTGSKNKAEPEDINPKAATRLRTAPVEAKDLVEAEAPATATAAVVASATETAVNTSIYSLVGLLMISPDAQVVVKSLCGLLEAIVDDSSDLLTMAIAGTNSAVVHAMVIHAGSPIVQAKACSLISHLAVDARNQFAICKLHGVGHILRAMDTHKDGFGVQKAALDGLGVLLSNNGDIQSIVKNDVVVAIGRALGNFSGDEKVAFQNKAFDVLSRMLP
jgi:hypothetical protein